MPTVIVVTAILTVITAIIVAAVVIPAVIVVATVIATTIHVGHAVSINVALLNVTRAEVVVIARLHEINRP